MRAFIALFFILAALATIILLGSEKTIGGYGPETIVPVIYSAAFAVLIGGWVVERFRGQWTRALEAIAIWMAIFLALVGGYAYRFEIANVANRIVGALIPGYAIVGAGGEVTINRSASGAFQLNGTVNGANLSFVLDTGASAVVLTEASAAQAGIRIADLVYSTTVRTANGTTQAAPVTLGRVTIGSITETGVRALVARSGTLSENLLGMSFLERLSSYRVQGDLLTLRGRAR